MTKYSGIENKVVFISGATKGIGLSIAESFASQGAKIVMNARTISAGHPSLLKIKEIYQKNGFSHTPLALAGDISDSEAVKAMFSEIKNNPDFATVDISVNNAGISRDGLFIRQKEEDWDTTIAINLKGVRNCCLEAIKMMRKSGGSIINISSVIGQHGNSGQTAYAASKAGVIGLTLSLADEYARAGIRVNAVTPGYIKTEMTENVNPEAKATWEDKIPLKRIGEGSEVGEAVLFLASDSSSYITGQTLGVDGGWFRR